MSDKSINDKMIFASPYILPVYSNIISDGALLIDNGIIKDISTANEVKSKYPDIPIRYFDDSILLPGLVNAHIHLEYSCLGPLSQPKDFISWIEDLIKRYSNASNDKILSSILYSINDLISSGITSIGEVSRNGSSIFDLINSGLKGTFYYEIVAVDNKRKKNYFNDFKTFFEKYKNLLNKSSLDFGIFPHSPYTLSQSVIEEISGISKKENVRLGMHAAESKYEKDFIRKKGGALVSFVDRYGLDTVPKHGKFKGSVDYLYKLGLLNEKSHLVHMIHIDESDFSLLEKEGVGIVICPKSNYFLKNGTFPFLTSLKYDIDMGIGTDSLASNSSLDLFEEMRKIKDALEPVSLPDDINERLIRIATIGGARVLGIDKETGSLEPGKCADIIAVKVKNDCLGKDSFSPLDYLVDEADASHVTFTMINGKVKYDRRI